MKIHKKYNNNVVQTYDEQHKEMIIIGSGIAYNKTNGAWIDQRLIEKKFVLQDESQFAMIANLLSEIPIEHFELSERIITFAEQYFDTKLNSNIHITLADHISFTLLRVEKGFNVRNPLLPEIKNLYEKEFVVGLFALDLIQKELLVTLPEDEAGFVVTHIIDAQMNQETLSVSSIVNLTNQIIKILKYQLKLELDENSIHYGRFLTHLKYFAQRVIKKNQIQTIDQSMIDVFVQNYPEAYESAERVCGFVSEMHDCAVNTEEVFYLALHLQRFKQKL